MGFFENMMGGLIDKEKAIFDTIQGCLENVAEELKCSPKDFFVMIKPVDKEFSPVFFIYKLDPETGAPKMVRELTIKEILSD